MDLTKTASVTVGSTTKTATCSISVSWSGGQLEAGASSVSCSIPWPKKKALDKSVPNCPPVTPMRLVTPPVSPGPTTMQEQMSWASQLELVDFSRTRMSSGWTLLVFSLDTTSAGLPTALVSDHEH